MVVASVSRQTNLYSIHNAEQHRSIEILAESAIINSSLEVLKNSTDCCKAFLQVEGTDKEQKRFLTQTTNNLTSKVSRVKEQCAITFSGSEENLLLNSFFPKPQVELGF
jgi:hypothetical protein